MKNSLEKRNNLKKNKPNFLRQDSNKYDFKNKWRKPRGLHNKRRLKKKGHQKNPSLGYGSPKDVKFMTKEGYNRVNINNLKDLEKVNKEKDVSIISSHLGLKKKLRILEKTLELGIKVENVKNVKNYIENKKLLLEENRKLKKKRLLKKEKSKQESIKKSKEKEVKEETEDKQKEIKEDILGAKQNIKTQKEIDVKVDTSKSKSGHKASSVPGSKQ